MSRPRRSSTYVIFFTGLTIGLYAGRNWLNFLSIMGVFALSALACLGWIAIMRRKRKRELQPALERMLDELIKTIEGAEKPLERFVIYNVEREESDRIIYHLMLHGGILPAGCSMTYDLKTETAVRGKNAGLIQVKFAAYFGTTYQAGLAYPDYVSLTAPDPWLTERLTKIRALVGDASLSATIYRQNLATAIAKG